MLLLATIELCGLLSTIPWVANSSVPPQMHLYFLTGTTVLLYHVFRSMLPNQSYQKTPENFKIGKTMCVRLVCNESQP